MPSDSAIARYPPQSHVTCLYSADVMGVATAAPRGVDKPALESKLAVNLTVQSWNVVAGTPKSMQMFPHRGT